MGETQTHTYRNTHTEAHRGSERERKKKRAQISTNKKTKKTSAITSQHIGEGAMADTSAFQRAVVSVQI